MTWGNAGIFYGVVGAVNASLKPLPVNRITRIILLTGIARPIR